MSKATLAIQNIIVQPEGWEKSNNPLPVVPSFMLDGPPLPCLNTAIMTP